MGISYPRDLPQIVGESIRVRGLVQGVGFRPTVWRLAHECGLTGTVLNDADGVLVHAWGSEEARQHFLERLWAELPPLARVDVIEKDFLHGPSAPRDFRILPSRGGQVRTGVVPDAATCPACVSETFHYPGRRFRYPFTNCAHCGPRLSIIGGIPYDRGNTSMAAFALCTQCRREFQDPLDRRFHAQPIACPICGPRVWLEQPAGRVVEPDGGADAVALASALLGEGRIVAIKGIGGVHLACDATDASAVSRLRQRKRRYGKPFAVMASDLQVVRRYCSVDVHEQALLEHVAAPIVILGADGPERVAPEVAPGQRTLGVMLPYTPLHHLLLQDLARPIVLTSGNLSQEPQCVGNEEARERLGTIAEYFLLHDRDIVNRVDDSVVRVVDDKPRLLRRARGYAPSPLALPRGFEAAPPLLALGGELKNTFCLVDKGTAILSQHMGDLEDATSHADQRRSVELYLALFQHTPTLLAVDQHPEYLATKMGREWAAEEGLPLQVVQHHHAHVAACLAENAWPLDAPPVLGVALDGLGYGADGTLWGGELLLADYRGFERLGALKPVPMLGGAQAIREPWRNTYAHIESALGWDHYRDRYAALELAGFLEGKPLKTLAAMRAGGLNSPLASSCGRLFDAVAAAIGVCRERAVYEGQAAVELEALVDDGALGEADQAYPFSRKSRDGLCWLDYGAFWRALFNDQLAGVPPGIIAARFHKGLARAVVSMVSRLSRAQGGRPVDTVALSGGVFQNSILLGLVAGGLRERGFRVLTHSLIPANDGGLALGQAVIAAAQVLDGNGASANHQ